MFPEKQLWFRNIPPHSTAIVHHHLSEAFKQNLYEACSLPPATVWDARNEASNLWLPCPDFCFTQQMVNLSLNLYPLLFPSCLQIFK